MIGATTLGTTLSVLGVLSAFKRSFLGDCALEQSPFVVKPYRKYIPNEIKYKFYLNLDSNDKFISYWGLMSHFKTYNIKNDVMAINITDLKTIKLSEKDVKIYLGDVKLYPQSSPTPTWTLVDDTFSTPAKIKVDYSLVDENDSEYAISTNGSILSIIYISQDIADAIIEQGGNDYSDNIGMVALFNGSYELEEILEDGVEYSSLGMLDFSDIQSIACNNSSPYLYAQ